MSEARDAILKKLPRNPTALPAAEARLSRHPRGPQPHWHKDTLTRFTDKLTAAAGSYSVLTQRDDLPRAIAEYLDANQLPRRLTLAPHPWLEVTAWPADIAVYYGAANADAEVTVSVASCGIAETGSLMLLAGAQTPTSLNFLADHFLCVLPSADIVPHLEDAWDKWRAHATRVPRAINIITGPSRTADVEQIIQLGAHGPRQLHVFLLPSN